ncbi:MAG: hypothetical protein KME10_02800 [Plectolyngbya sp. WJT66-NPBG17]|jgi:energy-coupling factor transporter ATP-binding protein EcfA2|nr:hypothetical protein [Plectolyngbya sp. WJT66-NPBG17]
MSKLIKSVSPETLQAWGVDPSAQVEYYDGTILVVDDAEPEGGIGLMVKAGTAALFGVAVFSNAPLVGATMFLYAGYKVMTTVKSLYGGSNSLTSRIEADLKVESVPDGWVKMPQLPEESQPVRIVTQLGEQSAIEVPSLNLNSNTAQTFDWSRLNSEYNDFPHLFLLGKTGSGKSYLSDRLVRFLNGYAIVITPKRMPNDFQGLQVVGLPYDFKTIHRTLTALEKLMIQRESEMQRTGKTDFPPVNVILDELPVSSAGCNDLKLDLIKPLKAIIRAGRTSKIRLIILAQGQEVKALGIQGEGGLRDSLSYVYLKGFVEEYASHKKIDISGIDRPCIIDGQIADTTFLKQFETTEAIGLDLGGSTASNQSAAKVAATPQDLDRMFNMPSAEHEVIEDGVEADVIEVDLQTAFPTWNGKSIEVASKVVQFLCKQPEKSFKPHQLKSSISALKKVDADKIKALLSKLADGGFIGADGDDYRAIASQDDDFNW